MGGVNFQDISQDLENAIKDSSALRSLAASAANPLATMADAGALSVSYTQLFNRVIGPGQPDVVINPGGFTPRLVLAHGAWDGPNGNHCLGFGVGIAANQQHIISAGQFVPASEDAGFMFASTDQNLSISVAGTLDSFTSANVTIGSWVNTFGVGNVTVNGLYVTILG
jgi:hypothetical protein